MQVLCGLQGIFLLFNCQTPGKGIQSFMISFLRYVAVILPAAFLLSRLFGAGSIWNAFWIAEFVTAAAAWALYRKVMNPKDESEKEILTEKKE